MLMGLSATIYGQSVFFDNTSPGSGLVLGALPSDQINGTLMGGPVGGSLVPIVTLTGGALLNLGGGLVYDGSGQSYVIPGVAANSQASLHMQFWVGNFPTYTAALAGLALTADSPMYSNPTGGGGVPPTVPAGAMANMPTVTLTAVPEPSTLALAGLGAAALLMYRRRIA